MYCQEAEAQVKRAIKTEEPYKTFLSQVKIATVLLQNYN
jgi:hypothetical protein